MSGNGEGAIFLNYVIMNFVLSYGYTLQYGDDITDLKSL